MVSYPASNPLMFLRHNSHLDDGHIALVCMETPQITAGEV